MKMTEQSYKRRTNVELKNPEENLKWLLQTTWAKSRLYIMLSAVCWLGGFAQGHIYNDGQLTDKHLIDYN